MPPSLKYAGKLAMRRAFELAQRGGVDVLPRHFYSEIPAIAELRRSTSWRRAHSMIGIQGVVLAEQLAFVRDCCSPDVLARLGPGTAVYDRACERNGAAGYGPVEALFLYCFIANRQPAKVLQVGAGVSTSIILSAAHDVGYEVELICIDPYPTALLSRLAESGDITLLSRPAQELEPGFLADLRAGDLLFVDSTHTVKPGSEVNHIVLEVLPRLRPGVLVHFHDIRFPYDYSPQLLQGDLFFWSETVLLQAFLTQNPHARILTSLSMLHHGDPEGLRGVLPVYQPAAFDEGLRIDRPGTTHFPSALYLAMS